MTGERESRNKMPKNIIAQVAGGERTIHDLQEGATVADIARLKGASEGYTAAINGDAASFGDELNERDVVTFAKAVKGGAL